MPSNLPMDAGVGCRIALAETRIEARLREDRRLMRTPMLLADPQDDAWMRSVLARSSEHKRELLDELRLATAEF